MTRTATLLTVQNGYTTTGHFDADNNQTALVDGDGNTTVYAFDAADQFTRVTDPDANATTYGLDVRLHHPGHQSLGRHPQRTL